VLVAGPCALEGADLNLAVAETLAELQAKLGLRVLFKGSFDKANRSNADAPRGPGLDRGLELLQQVRDETHLPILTDVHEVQQVLPVSQVVNALQIPAFLCRQTDLLAAAGRTGKPVNIKKGQWMTADGMGKAAAKVRDAGGSQLAVTERGTFFGYGDLVVDMRNFVRLREAAGCPVLFDATHAVQQPGRGADGSSGGVREHVGGLLKAAAAAGADGFFLETHPKPEAAPSDSATMWPLAELETLVGQALDVWEAVRGAQSRV
jgi:2-dehydro-3-deoxyphosphooctonate aldolase (KDO 8-P synthase)